MQEELITFETAKLAKEKGFDEICYYLHHPLYGVVDNSKYHKNSKLNVSDKDKTEYITAPTQSLLQKWLREVHKSVVTIRVYNNGEEWDETEYRVSVSEFKHFTTHDSFVKSDFSTYEEALEIGLQEALKLIEIVKDEKRNN